MRLTQLLPGLQDRHLSALRWFEDHAGLEVSWPQPLPDGTLLATRAKGIYKPHWAEYALSVRQSLESPYPDSEIETRADGTWRYLYFQENLDPALRDDEYTNQGLLACYRDGIPVGVLRQTRPKPNPRYEVLGLALVDGYETGYFVLDGITSSKTIQARDPSPQPIHEVNFMEAVASSFDPAAPADERGRAIKEVRMRQGQAGFRRQLLDAYGQRCAISNYDAVEALEAAHILPYRGPVTNHAQNGLLLRSDLHSLFDLGLVAVHEDTYRVILAQELRATKYRAFEGLIISVPTSAILKPSQKALARHRQEANL